MTKKTGVLLINLGTPDSPSVQHVRSYLSQFLNDRRVIDIPWLWRKILVNLIIVPFRASKSARIYKKLWTKEGSPLLLYSIAAQQLLQKELGDGYGVHLAMRYKNPSIPDVLHEMGRKNYDDIIVLPMFPQYASASTGSALDEVNACRQGMVGHSRNQICQPVLRSSHLYQCNSRTRQAVQPEGL